MEPLQFAGDHMTITEDDKGTATIVFDDKGTGRNCGSCQLCCKLVPVPPIHKPAGVRCDHAKYGKGCTIYASRPFPCRTWSCRWLADRETAGMPRPDRCHYVIDLSYDYITMQPHAGGPPTNVQVVQVWVDPAFRDAHRAPELRAYMLKMAENHGLATIVRWSSREALTIFPPPFDAAGKWHEISDGVIVARDKAEQAVIADAIRHGRQ